MTIKVLQDITQPRFLLNIVPFPKEVKILQISLSYYIYITDLILSQSVKQNPASGSNQYLICRERLKASTIHSNIMRMQEALMKSRKVLSLLFQRSA